MGTLTGSSTGSSSTGVSTPDGKFEKPSDFEYYVHYIGYDRRLDEWVKCDRIDSTSIEVVMKRASPNDHGRTRGNNRRVTAGGHSSGANDPAILKLEKEHEEVRKNGDWDFKLG